MLSRNPFSSKVKRYFYSVFESGTSFTVWTQVLFPLSFWRGSEFLSPLLWLPQQHLPPHCQGGKAEFAEGIFIAIQIFTWVCGSSHMSKYRKKACHQSKAPTQRVPRVEILKLPPNLVLLQSKTLQRLNAIEWHGKIYACSGHPLSDIPLIIKSFEIW